MLNKVFVGLDVHKDTITVAYAKGYSEVKVYGTIDNSFKSLKKVLIKLNNPEHLIVCYEAGPCGYVIYRQLSEIGVECKVAAPSLIPKAPGDRIKNDRRDAKKLASALRSNDLSYVWVPDEESEALRDLVRARECVVQDLTRAKNRITKFLLRNNVFPPEGINKWTIAYREWLNKQKFNPLQDIAFQEYLTALDEIELRRDRLNKALEQEIKDTLQVEFIEALKALKGIDTVTAATIACEIGDPRRFSHPRQIMSYLGAVPSEYSSGDKRKQGSITKAGNAHLRRVVIESCWSYRYKPKVSYKLRKRQKGISPEIKDISWRAQKRLYKRYNRLRGRGKLEQVAITAMARELIAFIWEVGQQVALEKSKKETKQEVKSA